MLNPYAAWPAQAYRLERQSQWRRNGYNRSGFVSRISANHNDDPKAYADAQESREMIVYHIAFLTDLVCIQAFASESQQPGDSHRRA
jgi:hypothetical protein